MERLTLFQNGFLMMSPTLGEYSFTVLAIVKFLCFSLDTALGVEYDVTNLYSGKYFEEEIQGLAAATGVSVKVFTDRVIGKLNKTVSLILK